MSDIGDMLYCENVCLVGGADDWDRKAANKADLVVRVNDHWTRQGGRCDGIYTRRPFIPSPDLKFVVADVDLVVDWQGLMERMDFAIYRGAHRHPELQWCNVFNRELWTMAFTGIMAIRHLTLMPIRSLHLTGFTFYAAGYVPELRHSHEIPPQVEWLRRLVKYDLRVSCDEALKKILEG